MAAWASSKKRRVSCCMLMTLQYTRDVQTEAGQVQSEVRIYRDIIISVSQMLIPHYPGARCLECYEPWHQAAASYREALHTSKIFPPDLVLLTGVGVTENHCCWEELFSKHTLNRIHTEEVCISFLLLQEFLQHGLLLSLPSPCCVELQHNSHKSFGT